MFRAKAKTNTIKLKDINKYIGRVWTNLTEIEVKKSKDLYNNRNKLYIQTDNEELKIKFGLINNIKQSTVKNISIVEENKMFTAQPEELPIKEEKVFIAEPPMQTKDFAEDKFTTQKVFNAEDSNIKLNLMADIEESQKVADEITKETVPDNIVDALVEQLIEEKQEEINNELNKEIENTEVDSLINNVLSISDFEVEDKFKKQANKTKNNKKTQIKNKNTSIYNTKQSEDTTETKKRRGRPPKSPQ